MPRTICVGVDDFGLHRGVNDAALHLAALGRVHAIGCLVGAGAWAAGSRLLRRLDSSRIDVGLHLDLTEFALLPAAPHRLLSLIAASHLRTLDRNALRLQIGAQLDTFEQALGRGPAFVDGHQHVHQLPVVRDELLDELARRYGGRRPWLRSTRSAIAARGDWRSGTKAWTIERLGALAMTSLAARRGFACNRRLLGVYDFRGGAARYRALLALWLRAARSGDLLLCHPSMQFANADALIGARRAEYEVLASAEWGALLRGAGLSLRSMSSILAAADSLD